MQTAFLNFPESQHIDNWALASLPAKLLALQNTTKPNRPASCFLYFARLLLLIFSYILPVFCFLYFAFYILFKNRYLKYNQLKPRQISPVQSYIFSCPEQPNRWPCLSVCLTQLTNRVFTTLQSDPTCDLWDIWSVRLLEDFQSFRRFSDFWETTTATKTILGFVTLDSIRNSCDV